MLVPVAQETQEGRSCPLGATLFADGANFSVYSKYAKRIHLLLFDRVDEAGPERVISIDPATNRTYHYWHIFVPGVKAGQLYGYRAEGPFGPSRGMRFDPAKVLLPTDVARLFRRTTVAKLRVKKVIMPRWQ